MRLKLWKTNPMFSFAELGPVPFSQLANFLSVEEILPVRRVIEQPDDVEQG